MELDEIREGYCEAGQTIKKACRLRGWSLRKLCTLTEIPTSRMDRIVHGARIRYEDGLRIEDELNLERGILSARYRAWARRRKKRAAS